MTPDQQSAFIFSQAVYAMVKALGMFSENMQRHLRGESMAYNDQAFSGLLDGIGWNDVVGFFNESGVTP